MDSFYPSDLGDDRCYCAICGKLLTTDEERANGAHSRCDSDVADELRAADTEALSVQFQARHIDIDSYAGLDLDTLPAGKLLEQARGMQSALREAAAQVARIDAIRVDLGKQLLGEQTRIDNLRQLERVWLSRAHDAEGKIRAYQLEATKVRDRLVEVEEELKVHREYEARKLDESLEQGIERGIELLLEPGAGEVETRKVAHLVLERDAAQAMKAAVADAIDECHGRMGSRQPIDVYTKEPSGNGTVSLVVNRDGGAWVREFRVPLNYALRLLETLGKVWVRHIEDRYVAKMGTALQKREG